MLLFRRTKSSFYIFVLRSTAAIAEIRFSYLAKSGIFTFLFRLNEFPDFYQLARILHEMFR